THAFGNVGDLVHEADLRCQHGVGRVLGQLCRSHVHYHEAVVVVDKGAIELAQRLDRAGTVRPDHDPVGVHAIGDGRPFLEELRIGDDVELQGNPTLRQLPGDCLAYQARRADGHGGLVDNDRAAPEIAPDGARDVQNVLEIRAAVLVGRCANRNKDDLVAGHRAGRV